MDLPPTLAPWAAELALFPPDVAVSLGDLVRRLALVVGPMRPSDAVADADGSGFDGIDHRGSYERLLLTEWLLADEHPEEFTRRAANGEHMFLRPARRGPSPARESVALFDAGPSQLGSPRVAHLALLVVLARRAAAAGATFRWGVIQGDEALRDDVTRASVLSLLSARTTTKVDAEALAARVARLRGSEVWIVGGARAVAAAPSASSVLVADVLDPERRSVTIEVRTTSGAAGGPKTATLDLPDAQPTARLLRDPFNAATTAPTDAARHGVPCSNFVFAANGTKLYARTANGVLAMPIPNSPRAGVGAPKLLRADSVIAAVGRRGTTTALLLANEGPRTLTVLAKRGGGYVGHFTSSEGPRLPFQPTAVDPLRPLLFRGDKVAFVDVRDQLFELSHKEAPRLIARDVLLAKPIADGYEYIGHAHDPATRDDPDPSWTHGTLTTSGETAAKLTKGPLDCGFMATTWAMNNALTVIALGRDRVYKVIEGDTRTEVTAPAGVSLIGVHRTGLETRAFALVVIAEDRMSISSIRLSGHVELLRTAAPITCAELDPSGSVVALQTADDLVLLYSLRFERLLHTFDFRGAR